MTNDLGYDYNDRINNLVTFVEPNFWISYSDRSRSYYKRVSPAGTLLDPTGKLMISSKKTLASAQYNGKGYIVMSYDKDQPRKLLFTRVDPATGSITELPSFISQNQIHPPVYYYKQSPPAFTEEINGKSLITFIGWTDMINSTYVDTWRTKASFYTDNVTAIDAENKKESLTNTVSIHRNPVKRGFVFKLHHVGSPVTINIYNALGKQVRSFHLPADSKRACEIAWDGKGNTGSVIPAGIYFVCFATQGASVNRKIYLF